MNRLFLLFLLVGGRVSFSDCTEPIVSFLRHHASITESNPAYAEESKQIERLFKTILATPPTGSQKEEIRNGLFQRLHENSAGVYEDSPDERRMQCRRSLILQALALLSDETQYVTYLRMAKEALYTRVSAKGTRVCYAVDALVVREYVNLLLVEWYLEMEHAGEGGKREPPGARLKALHAIIASVEGDLNDSFAQAVRDVGAEVAGCMQSPAAGPEEN